MYISGPAYMTRSQAAATDFKQILDEFLFISNGIYSTIQFRENLT